MKIIEKKRHIIRKAVYFCLIVAFILIVIDNVVIHTTYTRVAIEGLPDSFSGYRIVQVSEFLNRLLMIRNLTSSLLPETSSTGTHMTWTMP